jgi:hypothetical protein
MEVYDRGVHLTTVQITQKHSSLIQQFFIN